MRSFLFPSIAAGVLALITVSAPAPSAEASVVPMDLPDLVAGASLCVRGQVVDATSRWSSDGGMIHTTYRIQTIETLFGSERSVVEIRVPGGDLDGIRIRNSEAPTFAVGEEVVVFANPEAGEPTWRTYGCFQGKLTLLGGMVRERVDVSYDLLRAEILQAAADQGK